MDLGLLVNLNLIPPQEQTWYHTISLQSLKAKEDKLNLAFYTRQDLD